MINYPENSIGSALELFVADSSPDDFVRDPSYGVSGTEIKKPLPGMSS